MGFFKCLLLVALLANDVTAQPSWMWSQQQGPAPPQSPQQGNALPEQQQQQQQQHAVVPVKEAPVDKCEVPESEKIWCGVNDITAEQCADIHCCFDGQHCYYGETGIYKTIFFISDC